jgi:hypothetical protein
MPGIIEPLSIPAENSKEFRLKFPAPVSCTQGVLLAAEDIPSAEISLWTSTTYRVGNSKAGSVENQPFNPSATDLLAPSDRTRFTWTER